MILIKKIFLFTVLIMLFPVSAVFGIESGAFGRKYFVVTGAGRHKVNGTYVKKGNYSNHPKYVKGMFNIYYKDDIRGWVISRGGIPADDIIYKNNKETASPPKRSWKSVSAAKVPDATPTVIESTLFLPETSAGFYKVKGAGKAEVNGIYVPWGTHEKGGDQYTNGRFIMYYKGCHSKWMIIDGDRNLYKNQTDSKTPPRDEWKPGCGEKNIHPPPTVSPIRKPCLAYSKTSFYISNSRFYPIDNSTPAIITLHSISGESFTGTSGDDFVVDRKVAVTHLPRGLTPVITRLDDTHLGVVFTGESLNTDDVIHLTFAFQDNAFRGGKASAVMNSMKKDIKITTFNSKKRNTRMFKQEGIE